MVDITWLRAEWLWGLVPFAILCLFVWRRNTQKGDWESLVDPALQPYVLESAGHRSKFIPVISLLFCLLALLLLAGPVWQQKEAPAFRQQQAQVVLFDLSASMLTDDLKPSRLVRARYKLQDLLDRSQGVQMGLIAFSERPYVISPLSDDAATLGAFVESLSPEIMPVGGSRADLAIDKAIALLQQASASDGQIIMISDTEVNENLRNAIERARDAGFKLSILGAGTAGGAPLRGSGGQFVKDRSGAIVVPRVVIADYRALAAITGGVAVLLSDGDRDINALLNVQQGLTVQAASNASDSNADLINWVEYSPYFIPLLMLLLLPLFRRGASL
ncbi:MAG: VWA domain-containing protein [Granulosicoccaceae bacterium]